jgi:hypothetical protein
MSKRTIVGVVVGCLLGLMLGAGTAWAQTPIGPNQSFSGIVNGGRANVQVDVLCPGPIGPGRMGHVFGKQNWEVVMGGLGFTGDATSVAASFREGASTNQPTIFTEYGVTQAIPNALLLPCQGTGLAVFTPQVSPTGPAPRSATVTVRYVNVGV